MGQEPVTPEEGTQEVPEPESKTFDDAYVRKLRASEAESRVKARELAERLQRIEDAEKTELEKASSRVEAAEQAAAEAKSRANEAVLRAAVVQEATKQKAVDPDAVLAMIDREAVEVAEDGSVSGTEQVVARLLEAKPYLVASAPGPSGGGIRESEGEMSATEWRELARSDPKKFIEMRESGKVPATALGE